MASLAVCRALPKITCSISAGSKPARFIASRAAMAPSSTAVSPARRPPGLPSPRRPDSYSHIGVRAPATMNTFVFMNASLVFEAGGPLLEKRRQPFLHVGRGRHDSEELRLEVQAVVQIHVHAAVYRLDAGLHGDRPLRQDEPEHFLRRLHQLGLRHHLVHEADAARFLGRYGPAGDHELERDPLADEPRKPLRSAVTGDDPQVDLRLAE